MDFCSKIICLKFVYDIILSLDICHIIELANELPRKVGRKSEREEGVQF